ncbi:LytTR family DNA-binding domain-containing protein [Yoonia sp. SS1-5]|uniref:LytTR family DNA-binding domain-containing protein n=1 Tax=Yoonia rhodophyticola TaxID=3137370 RepID=A0AAN0MDD8_9RHOB
MNKFLSRALPSLGSEPKWWFLFGLGGLLAFIGPFGTFEALSLPLRLAYWVPIVVGSNVFVRLAKIVSDRWMTRHGPIWWQSCSTLLFSVTFSPAVWLFSGLFDPDFPTFGNLVFVFLHVLAVAATVGTLVYLLADNRIGDRPRLYSRLPDAVRSPVVRLTVDDHYVEVHLADGSSHRLLMRLADAVAEMDETAGFFTHRSHWVALAFVASGKREKNRDYLMLHTGAKVPISKTYREKVRAEGFL